MSPRWVRTLDSASPTSVVLLLGGKQVFWDTIDETVRHVQLSMDDCLLRIGLKSVALSISTVPLHRNSGLKYEEGTGIWRSVQSERSFFDGSPVSHVVLGTGLDALRVFSPLAAFYNLLDRPYVGSIGRTYGQPRGYRSDACLATCFFIVLQYPRVPPLTVCLSLGTVRSSHTLMDTILY